MITHINQSRYEALIKWLINARKERGLTVRQFAALINESHQFVNKVETQQRALKITEYVDYCEALGISPEEGLKLLKSQK